MLFGARSNSAPPNRRPSPLSTPFSLQRFCSVIPIFFVYNCAYRGVAQLGDVRDRCLWQRKGAESACSNTEKTSKLQFAKSEPNVANVDNNIKHIMLQLADLLFYGVADSATCQWQSCVVFCV